MLDHSLTLSKTLAELLGTWRGWWVWHYCKMVLDCQSFDGDTGNNTGNVLVLQYI